jgi:hypothetical protein
MLKTARAIAERGGPYDPDDARAIVAAAHELDPKGTLDETDRRIRDIARRFGNVAKPAEVVTSPFDQELEAARVRMEAARQFEMLARDKMFDAKALVAKLGETTWISNGGGSFEPAFDSSSTAVKRATADRELVQATEDWREAQTAYEKAAGAHTRVSQRRADYIRGVR